MPIEFRCTQCEKLLRTGDDTAGKQAKCPECGSVMAIPMPDQGSVPPSQPMGSFEAAASPFAAPPAPAPQDSENPYQSPTGLGQEQQAFAPSGEIRPTQIMFGETFSRTWAVFTDRWLSMVGGVFIVFVISTITSVIMNVALGAINAALDDPAIVVLVNVLVQLPFQILTIWLTIGLQLFALNVVRGREQNYGLLFAGGRFLLPVILFSLLLSVILALGFLLLVIPFFIFLLMFMQAQFLIIDRNMGVIDAMSMSRDVMRGNKLTTFLIGVVLFFVGIFVGLPFVVLTCGLGYFVLASYLMILSVVLYLSVTGQPTMVDRYMPPSDQPGGTPFGPTPGTASGDSPFSS